MGSAHTNTFKLPSRLNKKIGQAMHDYAMFGDGDRILLAVSGGVDSSVLAAILPIWMAKAPIQCRIKAVYIDNHFWKPEYGGAPPSERIASMLDRFGVEFEAIQARPLADEERTCFLCARNRRSQLFDLAREWQMNKIAFGHHMDDLVETFFLNLLYSGNISTMVPKQELFHGEVHIVRPMAYIEKRDILELADRAGITPVKNYCPIERETKRERVRNILEHIYNDEAEAKKSIFTAMANVRDGYLLKNTEM